MTIWTNAIEFNGRLEVDHPTIPLAELIMQKTQIVRINEKDLKDLCILLLDHDVDKGDSNTINSTYIADILSKDWGFYYTVTTNLDKLKNLMRNWANIFSDDQLKTVGERVDKLRNDIEAKDKSLRWKLRAKVGTKNVWYNLVEEVERTPFLEDQGAEPVLSAGLSWKCNRNNRNEAKI